LEEEGKSFMPSFVNSPINLRLDQTPPDSLPVELQNALAPLYNAFQQILSAFQSYVGVSVWDAEIQSQLDPSQTIFPQFHNRLYVIASEAIALGAPVNVFSNAGVLGVRNANATDATKPAHGYATAAIAGATRGEVILGHGLVVAQGAFVIGQAYWLNTVNGQYVAAPPVAAGNIEQFLGVGLSANELFFNCSGWIRH
jgi:hypothetical protein